MHNVNFTSSITLIGESAFENCGAIKKEEVCEGRRSVYISKKDIHKTYQEGDTEYRYYTYGNGQEYYELNIGYFNQENFRDSYNKYDSDIEVVLCVPGANKQKVYTHSYTGLEDIDLSNNNRTVFGKNVFKGKDGTLSAEGEAFLAGILHHIQGMTAVMNPLVNSYKRLVPGFEAPSEVTWSRTQRNALVHVRKERGGEVNLELRSPDCPVSGSRYGRN